MSNSDEIKALIHLLEDPDESIFNQVQGKLMEIGTNVIPHLEESWENEDLGIIFQKRIVNLIHDIQFKDVLQTFNIWVKSPTDLLDGVLLIDRYLFPTLNRKSIEIQLEQITSDIQHLITEHQTGIEKVMTINDVLFDKYGFTGDKNNYHAPENSYFIKILEQKKGNPLMLSILYLEISKRLGIPIKGINLPNHFIVGYLDMDYNKPEYSIDKDNYGVLFYINPFSKGLILQHNEIDEFLLDLDLEQDPKYYSPCDNLAIIKRNITNLIYSYSKVKEKNKIADLKQFLLSFK